MTGCRQQHSEGNLSGVDTPAPQLDIDKEELLGLIHNSEKPFVLVNFFATWCRPCREELPDLVELRDDSKQGVDVVLISLDKPADAKARLHNFLKENGVNFQTYARSRGETRFVKSMYPGWNGMIPLTLLYTNKGKQLEVLEGMTDAEEIKLILNKHRIIGTNS